MLVGPRNELVTAAACVFLATTITVTEIRLEKESSVPYWRKVVDYSLKHRATKVQETAATAMAAISKLVDCSGDVTR